MKKTDEWGYDLNRAKQERYAFARGYYWLPCPLCGFERGGHESSGEPSIPIEGQTNVYRGVCRRHPDARERFVYVPARVAVIDDHA